MRTHCNGNIMRFSIMVMLISCVFCACEQANLSNETTRSGHEHNDGGHDDASSGDSAIEPSTKIEPDAHQARTNGEPEVVDLFVSPRHGCALFNSGRFACWGQNWTGALGIKTERPDEHPFLERLHDLGDDGVHNGAVGGTSGCSYPNSSTCIVSADHRVRCWGQIQVHNKCDVCLRPETCWRIRHGPDTIARVEDAVEVVLGGSHGCARLRDDSVSCWGTDIHGAAGVGPRRWSRSNPLPPSTTASHLEDLSNVAQLTAGRFHTCAVHQDGTVSCWGWNRHGQLGTKRGSSGFHPAPVDGLMGVVKVSAGAGHTCVLRRDRTVWCWGRNDRGQLGDGSKTNRPRPTPVVGLNSAVEIATGDFHSCARKASGEVLCWGSNRSGQLGHSHDEDLVRTPQSIDGVEDADLISAGGNSTCIVRDMRIIRCWGELATPEDTR